MIWPGNWIERLWIVVSVLAIGICVFAANPPPNNGLPTTIYDETQFYALSYDQHIFVPISESEQDASRFYVRFDFTLNRWIWVTGHDPRAVVGSSKVQGKRLGVPVSETDKRGLDWYQLKDDWSTWKKVTDLKRPAIYRREWSGQLVVGEVYPDNWQSFGGQLDGQPSTPTVAPKCKLVPNPPTVKANQPLLLHLSLEGQVTGATITGLKVNLIQEHGNSYAELMLLPATPGFYTAAATAKGPGGETTCEVNYAVDPPDPKR